MERRIYEPDVRSDKELGNFLQENGIASLNDLIQSDLGKKT
jgi:hypothetical protein